jgi:hypothetical protein
MASLLVRGASSSVRCPSNATLPASTRAQAWLAMRKPTVDGLGSLRAGASRCDIECVHNAPSSSAGVLRDLWGQCSAAQAAEKLEGPDFEVTNKSDKQVQIRKLGQLNDQLRRYAREHSMQPRPSDAEPAAVPKLWLADVLGQARMPEKLSAASQWCDDKGIGSLDTLRDAEMEQNLVDALELREARAKILLKRLKNA